MPEPTTPAGATPAAGGATPPQTPPASPAAAPSSSTPPPATGDPDALGDAGKRALDAMKADKKVAEDRAKAAEDELAKLRAANQTEAEKALAEAKRVGEAEAAARYEPLIRQTRVELALASAGVSAKLVPLVARADEFSALKVENGDVKGLAEAVAAVKSANPDWFVTTPPRPGGSIDLGAGGQQPKEPTMNELLRAAAGH